MNILEEKEKRKEMIRKGLSKMSLVLSFLYDLWGVWAVGTFLIVLLLSVGSFTAAFWTKKSEPPLSLLPITISSPQDERVNYRLDLGDPRHLYSRYVFVWLPERVSRVLVEVPPLPKGASLLVGVAEGVKSEFMKDTREVGQITIEIARQKFGPVRSLSTSTASRFIWLFGVGQNQSTLASWTTLAIFWDGPKELPLIIGIYSRGNPNQVPFFLFVTSLTP